MHKRLYVSLSLSLSLALAYFFSAASMAAKHSGLVNARVDCGEREREREGLEMGIF